MRIPKKSAAGLGYGGPVRRVSVVGSSGAGKSTLGRRVAEHLGVPFVELDALHWQADWTPLDPDRMRARLDEITAGDGWVIDGNYRRFVDGPVWARADTVVWLDLPRRTVMRQLVGRTLGRVLTDAELWNGNRESVRNLVRWDPEDNVLRWSWTRHQEIRARYLAAMTDPAHAHLRFIRLCTPAEAAAFPG